MSRDHRRGPPRVLLGILLACWAAPAAREVPAASLGAGRFLVASERLRDPNFSRTVVLLIEHGREGAVGLVINRPTGLSLERLFPDIETLAGRADVVFFGGPVEIDRVMLLAESPPGDSGRRVFGEVYVSSSRELLESLGARPRGASPFRVFAGYAGWGPGQLEGEMVRGDWHVLPADAAAVFAEAPEEVWPSLILRTGVRLADRGPR